MQHRDAFSGRAAPVLRAKLRSVDGIVFVRTEIDVLVTIFDIRFKIGAVVASARDDLVHVNPDGNGVAHAEAGVAAVLIVGAAGTLVQQHLHIFVLGVGDELYLGHEGRLTVNIERARNVIGNVIGVHGFGFREVQRVARHVGDGAGGQGDARLVRVVAGQLCGEGAVDVELLELDFRCAQKRRSAGGRSAEVDACDGIQPGDVIRRRIGEGQLVLIQLRQAGIEPLVSGLALHHEGDVYVLLAFGLVVGEADRLGAGQHDFDGIARLEVGLRLAVLIQDLQLCEIGRFAVVKADHAAVGGAAAAADLVAVLYGVYGEGQAQARLCVGIALEPVVALAQRILRVFAFPGDQVAGGVAAAVDPAQAGVGPARHAIFVKADRVLVIIAFPRHGEADLQVAVVRPQRLQIAAGIAVPEILGSSGDLGGVFQHLAGVLVVCEIAARHRVILLAAHHGLVELLVISGIVVENRHLRRGDAPIIHFAVVRRRGSRCRRQQTDEHGKRQQQRYRSFPGFHMFLSSVFWFLHDRRKNTVTAMPAGNAGRETGTIESSIRGAPVCREIRRGKPMKCNTILRLKYDGLCGLISAMRRQRP